MAQSDTPTAEGLQFDRATTVSGSVAPSPVVVCKGCSLTIATQYYDVNGHAVCDTCQAAVAAGAETPKGIGTFVKAAAFSAGAGVVGAAIYYAVIAFAHLEIGIVAILIGYTEMHSRFAAGKMARCVGLCRDVQLHSRLYKDQPLVCNLAAIATPSKILLSRPSIKEVDHDNAWPRQATRTGANGSRQ